MKTAPENIKIDHVGMEYITGDSSYRHLVEILKEPIYRKETAHFVLVCVLAQMIKMT